MAAEIQEKFGIETELIKEGKGIFDVKVDGQLIFSRFEVKRFPEHSEVLEKISEIQSA